MAMQGGNNTTYHSLNNTDSQDGPVDQSMTDETKASCLSESVKKSSCCQCVGGCCVGCGDGLRLNKDCLAITKNTLSIITCGVFKCCQPTAEERPLFRSRFNAAERNKSRECGLAIGGCAGATTTSVVCVTAATALTCCAIG